MLWTWLSRIDKRLWWALVISVLLHFLLVAESQGWLPKWSSVEEPLEVTLAVAPPPKAKPVPRHVELKPERKHVHVDTHRHAPTPVPAPLSAPTPPPKPAPAAFVPPIAEPELEPVPQPEALPPLQDAAAGSQEIATDALPEANPPAAENPEPPDQPATDETPAPPPPRHVELVFSVDYDGASAVEKQNYQAFDDGHYVLTSNAQASGLLSLVLSDLNQKSSGQVTAQGLRPDTFTYQYGDNPKKAQTASFDWNAKTLMMSVGEHKQTVPLEDGTQDLLSFLYQFMFTPPLEYFQLSITTGKQLKKYRYLFDGEEQIQTKLGTLRTLHISKSSGRNEEKTDLWLAEDYHYLPVKIRKTDNDGKVIQNTIRSIKFDGIP